MWQVNLVLGGFSMAMIFRMIVVVSVTLISFSVLSIKQKYIHLNEEEGCLLDIKLVFESEKI